MSIISLRGGLADPFPEVGRIGRRHRADADDARARLERAEAAGAAGSGAATIVPGPASGTSEPSRNSARPATTM